MNAPDKFYIQPRTIDELPRQNIIYTKRLSDTSIEYIRKDALLEKLSRAKKLRLKSGAKESSDGIRVIDALIKMINEM